MAAPQPSTMAICALPGCTRQAWNGQPGEFCSRRCRAAGGQGPHGQQAVLPPVCIRPGCGEPAWDGQVGSFCRSVCRDAGPLPESLLCARPECSRPSWNGQPGEFCSRSCQAAVLAAMRPAPGTQVSQGKFEELQAQFLSKWKAEGDPPAIASIWHVHNEALLERHKAYCEGLGEVPLKPPGRNPGNQQRRFHATTMLCDFSGSPCSAAGCSTCSIIRSGFKLNCVQNGFYGRGIYSTSTSSKAYQYGNKRAMLVVGVAVGVAETFAGNGPSQGPLPSGCHSRLVSKFNDEIVVFEESAIVPMYLMVLM
uniref:PARP catalytic domain-containing protein n=1 Tax=Alexandrium monilatum TaxID=311494 RepID=A0A7S4Q5R8_9DINO|mmetsp:Transcript_104768/g.333321  ORF Transcript_104768/g.333321 Transcript_104768/m.333321 type:complete len:309 (-) Transcript_104768:20-946(-)